MKYEPIGVWHYAANLDTFWGGVAVFLIFFVSVEFFLEVVWVSARDFFLLVVMDFLYSSTGLYATDMRLQIEFSCHAEIWNNGEFCIGF